MAISAQQEPKGCRWIDGEPSSSDWSFCQKGTVTHSSYCPEHHARVYKAETPEELDQ